MYCVYFSFSSKNSINIAASPSPFIIGNYSLTALTPKHLNVCYSPSPAQAAESRQKPICISLGLTWTPPTLFAFLTFMYLTRKWLLKERTTIHWRRFLNSSGKRKSVNEALKVFHWDFWPKALEDGIFFFLPLAGSLNFIASTCFRMMYIQSVWEASSDWQFL